MHPWTCCYYFTRFISYTAAFSWDRVQLVVGCVPGGRVIRGGEDGCYIGSTRCWGTRCFDVKVIAPKGPNIHRAACGLNHVRPICMTTCV